MADVVERATTLTGLDSEGNGTLDMPATWWSQVKAQATQKLSVDPNDKIAIFDSENYSKPGLLAMHTLMEALGSTGGGGTGGGGGFSIKRVATDTRNQWMEAPILSTLTETGFYVFEDKNGNQPLIFVYRHTLADGVSFDFITQVAISGDQPFLMFIRDCKVTLSVGSYVWGEWHQIATTDILSEVSSMLEEHTKDTNNPHKVTCSIIGASPLGHKHSATDITSGILSVNRGGTGVSTLMALRNSIGLGNTLGVLPIANGGTGASTAANALSALGAAPSQHTHAEYLKIGSTGEAGAFDRSSSVPTATNVLRYNGYLRATRLFGVYFSDSADYAEGYQVEGDWAAGDLIAICEDGKLRRNEERQNYRVLGIVSTKPASLIGVVNEETDVPIALAGRVPVHCTGKVRPGDYLSASLVPGACEAVHPAVASRGSIVAQALEAGDFGDGTGLVLSMLVRM